MDWFFYLTLLCSALSLYQVYSYRHDYLDHRAVCLDYTRYRFDRIHSRRALYAYDVMEYGTLIHREVWTDAYGPLNRGQEYTIMMHKVRHEVIGTYSDLYVSAGFGICMGLYAVYRIIVWSGIAERLGQWL